MTKDNMAESALAVRFAHWELSKCKLHLSKLAAYLPEPRLKMGERSTTFSVVARKAKTTSESAEYLNLRFAVLCTLTRANDPIEPIFIDKPSN